MKEHTVACPNPECPDLEASGVHGEYLAGTELCPYCGTRLVESSWLNEENVPSPKARVEPGSQDLEAIFTTDDPAEIQIVRSILQGADIPYFTSHDSASDRVLPGFDPFRFIGGSKDAVFWVSPERAEEARALLTEADPGEDPDPPSD